MYNIMTKLAKVLFAWKVGAFDERGERLNYNLGVLLYKFKVSGESYDSFFKFLYVSLRNALISDVTADSPKDSVDIGTLVESGLEPSSNKDNPDAVLANSEAKAIDILASAIRAITELAKDFDKKHKVR